VRSWEELRGHNFEWVAATGDGLVAWGADLDTVMDEVEREHLAAEVVYALVDFDVIER
jgi:hypothetical protein